MIVAFDTLLLSKRYCRSGIHEYAKNLLAEFRQLSTSAGPLGFRYFVSPGYSDESTDLCPTPHLRSINTKLLKFHRLWQLGAGSVAAIRAGADLIFSPGPAIFPSRLLPVVVTIHDAMPVKLPSRLLPKSLLSRSSNWLAAKLSQKILTDSENSRRDLIEAYRLPPEKVSVVYLGYNRTVFTAGPRELSDKRLMRTHGIRPPYIFHHGMIQHRKNLARLIQAHRIFSERHPDVGAQLVLAGDFGFGSDEIRREALESPRWKTIFTGPLAETDLAELIRNASLCVIPSLYEGFCLPVIESMACGTPTIASNSSCIPEVSGGVLRYFDPYSVEEMADRIDEAIFNSALRAQLKEKGLKRATEFSWARCAHETMEMLAQFAGVALKGA